MGSGGASSLSFFLQIIYELMDELKNHLSGFLEPDIREEIVGVANVLATFDIKMRKGRVRTILSASPVSPLLAPPLLGVFSFLFSAAVRSYSPYSCECLGFRGGWMIIASCMCMFLRLVYSIGVAITL